MPDSPHFTPPELTAWSSLATLLEWLPTALDAQLQRDAGMSHFEFGLLFALSSAPEGTLRMSTLAEYGNSTLSRLSRAATRLEKRGWIRRHPDPADGRFTLATLLEPGRGALADAQPGHVAFVREAVLNRLGPRRSEELGAMARVITDGLQPGAGWDPQQPRS